MSQMMEKSIAISAPLKKAENIRKELQKQKLIRKDLKIIKNKENIYIPIKKQPFSSSCEIVEKKFPKLKQKNRNYKQKIELPEKLQKHLPTSYDIIGNIILIKIPTELQKHQNKIGQALLQTHKNIRTVCSITPVTGEYRTRNIKVLAGEKNTVTTHKEYGIKLKLDVEKTYFSPRLANERKRIADQVKKDENIIDMFTGVAPFPVMIARHAKPKQIYAIDKNPIAIKYAKQNIRINKVYDKIQILQTDAEKTPEILPKVNPDRIIMNLPFKSHQFFPSACQIIKNHYIIHYYDIQKENEISDRIQYLKETAERHDVEITDTKVNKIKTYAPRQFYIGIDITAQKNK